MSVFSAFIGGILSFFSIWIFCLMQVIPFFLAFIVGVVVAKSGSDNSSGRLKEGLFAGSVSLAVFATVFALSGIRGGEVSTFIFGFNHVLSQTAGAAMAVIGFYLLGLFSLGEWESTHPRWVNFIFGSLLGASMAIVYKPCMTPMLTIIYNIASADGGGVKGGFLLFFYEAGASLMILSLSLALAYAVLKAPYQLLKKAVHLATGLLLLTVATLVLTGNMTNYKSFLVGRFVPASMSHMGGEGGMNMEHGK